MSLAGCVENSRGLPVQISRSVYAPEIEEVAEAEKDEAKITARQDEFCWQFAANKGCFFSGAKAYRKAFGSSEITARDCASRLLNDPLIMGRIQKYLKLAGFTVENAQAVHADIMGNSEDDKTRLAAVKLLYEFEGKMVARTESTHLHISLSSLLKKAKETKSATPVIDAEIEIEDPEST